MPQITYKTLTNGVALIAFSRPEKRNAFSQVMITELASILSSLDDDNGVRAVVLTGSPEGNFCAGMDLQELVQISTAEAHERRFLRDLNNAFDLFSKPIIAAVTGYALGGGFEIALACDIILASPTAHFGLPEIKIGTIPGAGGTQRLTRAVGKHLAMRLILAGDSITGAELERLGVVSKVFPVNEVVDRALELAARLAALSGPVLRIAKEAVLISKKTSLEEGLESEKRLYYSTFDLADCKEGISAFLQKREPKFVHQ